MLERVLERPGKAEEKEREHELTGVLKIVELVGTSSVSFEDAIARAVKQASATLRHVNGVVVKRMSLAVADGEITEYRVDLKVGFALEKDED